MLRTIEASNGIVSNYSYDFAYRLLTEDVNFNDGKRLWHNKFVYDNMGNRVTVHKNGVEDHYTYNAVNQITGQTKTAINVKGMVNGDSASVVLVEDMRAKTTYMGDNLLWFEAYNIPVKHNEDSIQLYARINEILATVGDSSKYLCTTQTFPDGNINIYLFDDIENVNPENINTIYIEKSLIEYLYDSKGNMVSRLSPGDTTTYQYDAENRLTRVDLPGGNFEEYGYDGFGQRIKVSKNGTLFKSYVYDNYFEAVAITDAENKTQFLTRGLGYAGGIGGIVGIFDEENGNITNYFNHRGDLICATDMDENTIFSVGYDAFGSLMNESGMTNTDYGFSSKELDSESGLYNFGARYYSPEEQRWLTRDPLGFHAGFNMYEFVGSNPAMLIDPYGYDIPPDIEDGLRALSDHLNSTEGVITRETVINAIEQMSRTGQLAANFMSRVSGMARAGSVFTGVLQTFLTPEGAAAMRGAIQLTQALRRENDMVRRHNLLGCGQRLRPGQRRLQRAARNFRRSFIGRVLYWPN